MISNFRLVVTVTLFLFGDSPESEFYVPTFRSTLSGKNREEDPLPVLSVLSSRVKQSRKTAWTAWLFPSWSAWFKPLGTWSLRSAIPLCMFQNRAPNVSFTPEIQPRRHGCHYGQQVHTARRRCVSGGWRDSFPPRIEISEHETGNSFTITASIRNSRSLTCHKTKNYPQNYLAYFNRIQKYFTLDSQPLSFIQAHYQLHIPRVLNNCINRYYDILAN